VLIAITGDMHTALTTRATHLGCERNCSLATPSTSPYHIQKAFRDNPLHIVVKFRHTTTYRGVPSGSY